MIRFIVSDIDGTLLPEGGSRINPEYMTVIRKLTDLGIKFAAASGRQASSVDAVFHEISDRIYYLSDNGAFIQKNGEPVREVRMDQRNVEQLLRETKEIPDCHVLLSAKEGYYTDDQDLDFYDLVFRQYKGTGEIVENLMAYTERCIKLSLYSDGGSRALYDKLSGRWKDKVSISISGEKWLDINDVRSTKGNAVAWIQAELQVTPEETVVFGDNFNDISMLRLAKWSYAPAHSHENVRRAARYEVGSYEEDGVLKVLKRILEETKDEN